MSSRIDKAGRQILLRNMFCKLLRHQIRNCQIRAASNLLFSACILFSVPRWQMLQQMQQEALEIPVSLLQMRTSRVKQNRSDTGHSDVF